MSSLPLAAPPPLADPGVTLEQMQDYLAVSGDVNPLHEIPDLAQRIGMDGIPVPGMLIMGRIAAYLAAWPALASMVKLTAKFTSPVLLYTPLELSARIARQPGPQSKTAILRVLVKQDGRIAVIAESEIVLR